jgi:transcription elongation factor GreA
MDNPTFVTAEGLEKLREELAGLKTSKRKEIANRIQEAKELGDLSENAEYAEAKNEQAFVEGRILELETILKNATLIQNREGGSSIRVGAVVKVKSEAGEQEFEIVGSNEADPPGGKISNESPLGKALLGHKVGDTITITLPKGERSLTVSHIR